jgi:hypothetical protein
VSIHGLKADWPGISDAQRDMLRHEQREPNQCHGCGIAPHNSVSPSEQARNPDPCFRPKRETAQCSRSDADHKHQEYELRHPLGVRHQEDG